MSEKTDQPPQKPDHIRETMAVEAYNSTIAQERREKSVRVLLGLPDYVPIPGDADASIENIIVEWKEDQKYAKTVLNDYLRQLLNLRADDLITDNMIPSVEEVRRQFDKQIPYDDKLSEPCNCRLWLMAPLHNAIVHQSMPYIAKHNINSSDALFLRQAVWLQQIVKLQDSADDVVFVTADKRLFRAARSEGLLILDPETVTESEVLALLGASSKSL